MRLAGAGANVVIAARSIQRGGTVRDEILARHPAASLEVRELDLANLSSIRAFADDLYNDHDSLDLLVNNAGVLARGARQVTVDGFELHLGTNALGPLALTVRLLPLLLRASQPCVATMASEVGRFAQLRMDDLQWQRRPFNANSAYGQSKFADFLLAAHLASVAAEGGWALKSTVAHPGYTVTNLVAGGSRDGTSTPRTATRLEKLLPTQGVGLGCEPLLFAATDPTAKNGAYYGPGHWFRLVGPTVRTRLPRAARDEQLATEFWALAERLTGVSLDLGTDS